MRGNTRLTIDKAYIEAIKRVVKVISTHYESAFLACLSDFEFLANDWASQSSEVHRPHPCSFDLVQ